MKNYCCDIIVPIYNAYYETVECINSVIRNTRESYRLILINDKSTDIRIEEWLRGLETEGLSNVVIMDNNINLGFVKTVNKGIIYSKNDVVILNSDTVVTEGWLEKLKDCAYSNDNIATVTPLTNSGSLCSVPKMGKSNTIPQGLTMQEYGLIIEKISLKKYPTIPIGVGFCIFIKRKALDIFGVLDENAFDKGYGEEIDFCLRAAENGFINVLCDDTFIYHKGSMSFKDLREKYVKDNTKILDARYPYYMPMMSSFAKQNPLRDIQNNIEIYTILNNNKRNILHVLSAEVDNPYKSEGNISFFNTFFLFSNGQELIVAAYVDEDILYFRFDIGEEVNYTTFDSWRYAGVIESIIKGFKIDLIHVHQLKGHTFNMADLAERHGIPIIMTLYDIYLICPSLSLLCLDNIAERNCITKEECYKYIRRKLGYTGEFIETWNKKVKKNIHKFNRIYTFSGIIKDLTEKYYDSFYSINIGIIELPLKFEGPWSCSPCDMLRLISESLIEGFYEKGYDELLHGCQLRNFDKDSYHYVLEGYKNYNSYRLYKDIFSAISKEIKDEEWDMHLENISRKVAIDKELIAYMRFGLSYIKSRFRDKTINYLIWGAGSSGKNTKAVMEEIMPDFRLIGYIDKYKEGSLEEVDIYKPEDIGKIKFDYIVVASSTGKEEVAGMLHRKGLSILTDYIAGYGIILDNVFNL